MATRNWRIIEQADSTTQGFIYSWILVAPSSVPPTECRFIENWDRVFHLGSDRSLLVFRTCRYELARGTAIRLGVNVESDGSHLLNRSLPWLCPVAEISRIAGIINAAGTYDFLATLVQDLSQADDVALTPDAGMVDVYDDDFDDDIDDDDDFDDTLFIGETMHVSDDSLYFDSITRPTGDIRLVT